MSCKLAHSGDRCKTHRMVATIRALDVTSPSPVAGKEEQDANHLAGEVGSSSSGFAANKLPRLSDEEVVKGRVQRGRTW